MGLRFMNKFGGVFFVAYSVFLSVVIYICCAKYAFILFEYEGKNPFDLAGFLSDMATVGVFIFTVFMWRDAKNDALHARASAAVEKLSLLLGSGSFYKNQYKVAKQLDETSNLISMLNLAERDSLGVALQITLKDFLAQLKISDLVDSHDCCNPIACDLSDLTVDIKDSVLRAAVISLAQQIYIFGAFVKIINPESNQPIYCINSNKTASVKLLTKITVRAHPIINSDYYLYGSDRTWRPEILPNICIGSGLVPPMVAAFFYLNCSRGGSAIFEQIENRNK